MQKYSVILLIYSSENANFAKYRLKINFNSLEVELFSISITRLSGRYLLDFWPKFVNNSAFENNSSDYILR